MRQVIRTKLKLKSIGSAAFGASHDASILNEDVQLLALGGKLAGAFANRLQGVEIEVQESHSITVGNVAESILGLLDFPSCKVQSGTGAE
jgi:hypothetical protein